MLICALWFVGFVVVPTLGFVLERGGEVGD